MRYKVCISYNGNYFYGFQVQKDKTTVSGVLTKELSKIFNESIKVAGCSRTDKGVHAKEFYFHFDSDKVVDSGKLRNSLNKLTGDYIYVKSINKVSNEFHARYNVKYKEYVYVINMGEYDPLSKDYELEYNKNIDIRLLKKCSKYLIGKHDFKSFTSDNEKDNTIRTIKYIKFNKVGNKLYIYISADGFLKYMVRNIIGLFIEINDGIKSINDISYIINSKDRTKLGIKALPNGLYLNKVEY